MSRRTQNRNQYESTTVGELAAGAFSVTVDSAAGLTIDQPIYLVIEPDIPGQREWIRVNSITGNQLNIANPNGRDLTGSDGDKTHPAGSKVRSVPTQQIFEDLFQDIEETESAAITHANSGGDPHANAGYLVLSETDARYVRLDVDTTLNPTVNIKTAETVFVSVDLVPKAYVDTQDNAHDGLAGAHGTKDDSNPHNHDRYADQEAIDAVATPVVYLRVDGFNPMTGPLDMDGNELHNLLHIRDTGAVQRIDITAGQSTVLRGPSAVTAMTLGDTAVAIFLPVQMNNEKITGMADGTADADAVNFDQMETADNLRVLLTAASQTITGDLTIDGELTITEAAQNLLQDLVRNVTINDGAPAVGVRGSLWLDPTDSVLSYSDGAAWVNGLSDLLNLPLNVVHTMAGRLLGPAGSVSLPAFAVGNSTSGLYQEGSFIGLTRNSNAVIVGNGTDQLYADGIVSGTGDDIVATGTQLFRVVSSKRFKNVGAAINKAAIRAKLMALPVYEWTYKNSDEEQIGWLAEDVAEVDARLVNWDDEGKPSSIRTLAIMAVLT